MEELEVRPGTTLRRFALAALVAVELLMSFSFLGYFHVEPISVTTAYLPVLLAGALLGPLEAGVVGAAFGLASMWKASASYVMAADQLFSPLFSGNPMGSVLLSVGSRMLFGVVIGLLYLAVRRLRPGWLWVGAVSFFGRTVHSLMVYSVMALCFPAAGFGPGDAFSSFWTPMNLLSNLATALMVLAVWLAANSRRWRRFSRRLELYQSIQAGDRYHRLSLAAVLVLTVLSALAVAFYFAQRIQYVLSVNGIQLTAEDYGDVLHLQVQFLFGIISLMVLVILFLILNRRHTAYTALAGKQDSLTGVMTRKAFFGACGRVLGAWKPQDGPLGYFIMVDLDYFKVINDTRGHPEGDRALKEVARNLREVFGRASLIGRMGGDEFALLVWDLGEEELEVCLRHFLERVRRITWEGWKLTCSVGALAVPAPRPAEKLYLDADRLLYAAKEKGRDRYEIGGSPPEREGVPPEQ